MSYDVAIVIPPIPADDPEAWRSLEQLIDQQGPVPPTFRTLHDRLSARYPCISTLPDEQQDEGVWTSGPLWNDFGHRVASLNIRYSRVEEVLPFLIETATSLDLAVFDCSADQIHRTDGFSGLSLVLESKRPLRAPTLLQLHAAVDSLTPLGGPGFLILEGPSDDYAQAAGGDGAYTAEWRQYSGKQFMHCVAGIPGHPSKKEIAIKTNGCEVTVQENERLDETDVKAILVAFAEHQGPPGKYAWRDVTQRFV